VKPAIQVDQLHQLAPLPAVSDGDSWHISPMSPATLEVVHVRVGCDYKWTIEVFETLDFDPQQKVPRDISICDMS